MGVVVDGGTLSAAAAGGTVAVPSNKEDAEFGGCGICGTVGVVVETKVLLTEFGIFGYGSMGMVVDGGILPVAAAAVPSKKDETEFGG